jgi:hypothetical protein
MLDTDQEPPHLKQTEENNPADLLLRNHEERLGELEKSSHKTTFKRLTETASASALLLGLILTFVSLRDAFISKPEADRIARLSQFNQAVNSAAKLRQDLTISSLDSTTSAQRQMVMISMVGPQILNEISTARAILKDLKSDDVGIPQLIILISEAFNVGDFDAAKTFVAVAVDKTNVTPYLRSEAKRYEGRLLYFTGNPVEGHKAFEVAMDAMPVNPATLATRAYILSDLIAVEYQFGDCISGSADFQRFLAMSKDLADQQRQQIGATLKTSLLQARACPQPENLASISVGDQVPAPPTSVSIPGLLNAAGSQDPAIGLPPKHLNASPVAKSSR